MEPLFKRSDKVILFVAISLGTIALLHPHLAALLGRDSGGGRLQEFNGKPVELGETEVLTPELVQTEPKLDLNSAGAERLEALPGVGPVLAERIVFHRRKLGQFSSPSELTEVDGIGPATLKKIKKRVRVEG